MAEQVVRFEESATYFATETTFDGGGALGTGSLPTFARWFPSGPVELVLNRKANEMKDLSVYRADYKGTVDGLPMWTAKVPWYPHAAATQLVHGATPTTPSSAAPVKNLFGGSSEHAGGTIASASSVTGFTFTTGHGAAFQNGDAFAVQNAAGNTELTQLASGGGTDTVTVFPPLSGTPSALAVVPSAYAYFHADQDLGSLAMQHAEAGSTSIQYQLLAGTGELAISMKLGALVELTANLMGKDFLEGTLGISTSYAQDGTQLVPFDWPVEVLLCAQGASTRASALYSIADIDVTIKVGKKFVPSYNKLGAGSVIASGERPIASLKFKALFDRTVIDTWWANRTALYCHLDCQVGTGAAMSHFFLMFPHMQVFERPKETPSENVLYNTITLNAMLSPTASTAIARAAMVMGWI